MNRPRRPTRKPVAPVLVVTKKRDEPVEQQYPDWMIKFYRRLCGLTKGRYFAIIDVKPDGVVDGISVSAGQKVEKLNRE